MTIESTGDRPTPAQRTRAGLMAVANGLRRYGEQLLVLAGEAGPQAAAVAEALARHAGRLEGLT